MKASPAPVVSTDATSKGDTSSVPSSLAKRHPRSPLVMTTRLTPCAIRNCAHSFASPAVSTRSEEHTSELQSRSDLVCRLLLEKKNDVFVHLRVVVDHRSFAE